MRVESSLHDGRVATEPLENVAKGRGREQAQRKERAPAEEGPSPFARVLQGLGREVDRGEAIVKRAVGGASGGQDLSNLELLSLQAGVYRYSEAVDLSAKLVDRATSGVKTVLQGQ